MTGIGTVLADDPGFSVRDIETARQPLRVVIDPQLRFRVTAKMLKLPGRTLVFTLNDEDVHQRESLEQSGAEVILLGEGRDSMPRQALAYLAEREECNEILLESGSKLAGSMLEKGLIDELIIYMAPVLLGSDAKPLFQLPGISRLTDRKSMQITEIRRIGEDVRITLVPQVG